MDADCLLRGRRGTFGTSGWICVAGVTLSAPQARCVWQAWHFRCLHRCPQKLGDDGGPMDADCSYVAGVTLSAPQARCVCVCVACVAFSVPS